MTSLKEVNDFCYKFLLTSRDKRSIFKNMTEKYLNVILKMAAVDEHRTTSHKGENLFIKVQRDFLLLEDNH